MNANALLATGPISIWLLVAGLFFPRLSLAVAWFMTTYPANTLPVLLDFFGWLFFPRFLMAYYIYTDIGTNNLWFWAYVALGILGLFGESGMVHRRVRRKRTVTRNGHTTTTVEEEEI